MQEAAGAVVSATAAGSTWAMDWLGYANEWLQLVATVVAITVGLITIYSHFKRRK